MTAPALLAALIVPCALCHSLCGAEAVSRVMCFGDSITAGSALPAAEKAFVWPSLVEKASGGRLRMINEGKGGRPTASLDDFAKALDKNAAEGSIDVVLIALGGNDSRDISDECVPKAVANLRKMIEHARGKLGAGAQILLVAPLNIRKDALGPTKPIADQRDQKLRELGAALEKLAKDMACNFVSICGVVATESLSRDGVHPDKAGNEAIARVLLERLLAMRKPRAQPPTEK